MKSKINQENRALIMKEISTLDRVNYDTVSKLIPELLVKGSLQLELSNYKPNAPTIRDPNGVGRYLIYDHDDKNNPFSIWVFAIAPGKKTSIHDHQYRGTVTAITKVSEKYYQPNEEDGSARLIRRVNRHQFHTNRDDLESTYVHQLKCREKEGISLTLHIYNMEAYKTNSENEQEDNRNLKKFYSKDKTLDKSDRPAYEEERYFKI